MTFMTIKGDWATRRVWVDGVELKPQKSQKVWNHSPDGFNWGYGGSGPAQLALAILLHAGLDKDRAVQLHQEFKWEHVARWPQADVTVDVDMDNWRTKADVDYA
jgi:hypothetical protein